MNEKKNRSSGNLKLWISVALAVIVIIVVVQNRDPVDTKILFFTVSMPRALLLFVTFIAGAVVGMLAFSRKKKA